MHVSHNPGKEELLSEALALLTCYIKLVRRGGVRIITVGHSKEGRLMLTHSHPARVGVQRKDGVNITGAMLYVAVSDQNAPLPRSKGIICQVSL